MTTARPRVISSAIEATSAFLRQYPPFDAMEDDAVHHIASHAALVYHAKDATILAPAHGVPASLFIVGSGEVRLSDARGPAAAPNADVTLGPGECYSIGAMLEKRPTGATYTAATDTFCYALPAADVDALLARSPRFREFSTAYLASLLRESRRLLRMDFAGEASEQYAMGRTLRSLITRKPVTCARGTPLREALGLMSTLKIGSILVVDRDGAEGGRGAKDGAGATDKLVGILTERDVLERVALAGRSLDEPIEVAMTADPVTLEGEANAYEAALLIAQRGFRHVPVTDHGRLIGMVTERDLFARQRMTTRNLNRSIDAAVAVDDLAHAAHDVRGWVRDMVGQGLAAEHLVEMSTTLNDALTRRIIQLESVRHDLAGIEWAWLAFGSEGRYEQTISTDQDNGLIFVATEGSEPNSVRERLLPFARAVNRTLDACGFPFCTGDIMAGNARWCLGIDEWKAQFGAWIANTDAQQLLNAAIFFDFRTLYGTDAMAGQLHQRLFDLVAARPVFLRQMAEQARASGVPLGFMGGIVTDSQGHGKDGPGRLDLKKGAARLFVDAARVMALATGVAHTNTAHRLRQAGARWRMSEDEIGSAIDAFFFIQALRLRVQVEAGNVGTEDVGLGTDNRGTHNLVDPRRLNEIDRRLLKESLRQARRLQERLALEYRL